MISRTPIDDQPGIPFSRVRDRSESRRFFPRALSANERRERGGSPVSRQQRRADAYLSPLAASRARHTRARPRLVVRGRARGGGEYVRGGRRGEGAVERVGGPERTPGRGAGDARWGEGASRDATPTLARRRHVARFPATRDRERRPRRGLRREHHRRPPRGGGLRLGGRDVRPGPGRPRLARPPPPRGRGPRREARPRRRHPRRARRRVPQRQLPAPRGGDHRLRDRPDAARDAQGALRDGIGRDGPPPRPRGGRGHPPGTRRLPGIVKGIIVDPGIRRLLRRRLGRRLGALRVHVLGGGDVRDARPGFASPRVPRGEVRVRRPQPEVRRGALREVGRRPRARKRRRGRRVAPLVRGRRDGVRRRLQPRDRSEPRDGSEPQDGRLLHG